MAALTTTWAILGLTLSLPRAYTQVQSSADAKPLIRPAIPGAQVEETFSSWRGPKGQALFAYYWVPYPPHDGGPIESVKEWREAILGESVSIRETKRFMGSEQTVLVAALHPKNPEGTFMIYAKGMSRGEFTRILKSLRESK